MRQQTVAHYQPTATLIAQLHALGQIRINLHFEACGQDPLRPSLTMPSISDAFSRIAWSSLSTASTGRAFPD